LLLSYSSGVNHYKERQLEKSIYIANTLFSLRTLKKTINTSLVKKKGKDQKKKIEKNASL
jgi:hypothetical protein